VTFIPVTLQKATAKSPHGESVNTELFERRGDLQLNQLIGRSPSGVSHFSALKTASQRENIQNISENAIAGWVIVLEEYGVMESIPTYASR